MSFYGTGVAREKEWYPELICGSVGIRRRLCPTFVAVVELIRDGPHQVAYNAVRVSSALNTREGSHTLVRITSIIRD